jgi:hypothetical protein
MLKNVATATAAVMKEVKRLKKADNNAFAKYRYTSVDDFKDALRPLLAKHGLVPNAHEVSCETFEKADEKAKVPSLHAKFRFELWLEHISGEEGKPEGLTVMMPYTGAQTTGAARSYAIKEWLKSKFLASSGDSEDADEAETVEELSKAEARPIYTELEAELRAAAKKGEAALREWADRRRPSIEVMPKDWRVLLRREFKEGLATAGHARKDPPPVNVNQEFLREVEETLSRARTPDEVEQFFDELDVQAALTDDEPALERAFQIKAAQMARVGEPA